jgi:hypothetical protein
VRLGPHRGRRRPPGIGRPVFVRGPNRREPGDSPRRIDAESSSPPPPRPSRYAGYPVERRAPQRAFSSERLFRGDPSSGSTSYPCVNSAVQPPHDLCDAGRSGRASGSTYQTVLERIQGENERAPLFRKVTLGDGVSSGDSGTGGWAAQARRKPNLAAVVCWVASLQRSTANRRATATIAFLRLAAEALAPRASAVSLRQGPRAWQSGW